MGGGRKEQDYSCSLLDTFKYSPSQIEFFQHFLPATALSSGGEQFNLASLFCLISGDLQTCQHRAPSEHSHLPQDILPAHRGTGSYRAPLIPNATAPTVSSKILCETKRKLNANVGC